MNNKSVFAQNLKTQMSLHGKTRKDIADALDLSYYTVSDWVNGKKYPRMDKVERLAQYFGILKSDLIEEKLTPEKEKDNDTLANIIVRLRTDQMYRSVVESIYNMNPAQLESVDQMLKTLEAFRK